MQVPLRRSFFAYSLQIPKIKNLIKLYCYTFYLALMTAPTLHLPDPDKPFVDEVERLR